jgi:hypothetical protein
LVHELEEKKIAREAFHGSAALRRTVRHDEDVVMEKERAERRMR